MTNDSRDPADEPINSGNKEDAHIVPLAALKAFEEDIKGSVNNAILAGLPMYVLSGILTQLIFDFSHHLFSQAHARSEEDESVGADDLHSPAHTPPHGKGH